MGDGRLGCPDGAPYDAIHVGAAAPTVPKAVRTRMAFTLVNMEKKRIERNCALIQLHPESTNEAQQVKTHCRISSSKVNLKQSVVSKNNVLKCCTL